MERKLAAIFSADVKGYSRLMGDDELATVRTLTAYRDLLTHLILQHHGRVVDSPGDNILAEFASVVDAVQCATKIQQELKTKNAELAEQRQMQFRIGINVGDVLTEDGRLYGDGVNIAARLEGLAEPGGICISETAYTQVKNKLALGYQYIGEQQVKNIAEPVRAYTVQIAPDAATTPAPSQGLPIQRLAIEKPLSRRWRWVVLTVAVLLCVGVGTIVLWRVYVPSSLPSAIVPEKEVSALPLPDKPSLVVLPFVNMSEDPTQDYFSDGITEDLTAALSQISRLFVIARNSAFTYKGKAVKVQDVGKELGVQYVLEGSVRRANDQVRITAQLIDAATDSHLWAQRYDSPLKDIFALQDEIVQKIVTTLKLQLTLREQGYLVRKTTDNLKAYDTYLRGLEAWNRYTKETNDQARQLFEQAIELDPQYAEAYACLSRILSTEWIMAWNQDPEALERALVVAQQAVALDDSLPGAHEALALAYAYKKQHEQAITAIKRAIVLAPNDAEGYANLGQILLFAGRPEETIGLMEKAMHLNPRYPVRYSSFLGMAYVLARRYEEALAVLQSATLRNPNNPPPHLHLLVSYSELGRDAEARAELAEIRRINPNVSLEWFRRVMVFKDPTSLERYLAALRKAGLK